MDKTWIYADRRSKKYQLGVSKFLQFALENARNVDLLCCPCLDCGNTKSFSSSIINEHLYFHGFDSSYQNWIWHGEAARLDDPELTETDLEATLISDEGDGEADVEIAGDMDSDVDFCGDEEFSKDSDEFREFVEDGCKPMYPGCTKFTKLNALVRMYNLKAKNSMTDACFEDILIMVADFLPEGNELPTSCYEAKKILGNLGMNYRKIHACPNDCILYRNEYANNSSCPTCLASRWQLTKDKKKIKEGTPAKVMWYFPLIPRFRRMFQSPTISEDLKWHSRRNVTEGIMRHPADSPAWKLVDNKWPDFSNDIRNLRIALSTDGFNPHGSMSSRYSCWPVVIIIYNLPPWLTMKRKFMMLNTIISGPKQPGNNIDVYLQVIVDELKILWEGVPRVYDAHLNEHFTLRAVLMWTISDFPAYGNLSGHVVKGYNGCPICLEDTKPIRLGHSNKMAYLRNRRFLGRNHPYRKQKAPFNNQTEFEPAPFPLTGEQILDRVSNINCVFGRKIKPPTYRPGDGEKRPCFKKKSVFFELPYWKFLLVRHNLDVMHIEKNCVDSLVGTLLNIPGKTKDGIAARLDLIDLGWKTELKAPVGKKLSLACWNLTLAEKKTVCNSLFGMKLPEGYCSNIQSLVSLEDNRLVGLKSHDCHTLMQQLLPICIRSVLDEPVRYAIIRFCHFFNVVCSKVIDCSKLQKTQADLVETLCLLEVYFPPSLFDIMYHLTLHLVREVELCGPVWFRWMYPFERYMKVLKGYVKNKTRPEGCMAEKKIAEEGLELISEQFPNIDTVGIPRKSLGLIDGCKPLSGATMITVDEMDLATAHLCVLENTEEVQSYILEYKEILKGMYPQHSKKERWLKDKHNRTFSKWLKDRVSHELQQVPNNISESLRWMADGPNIQVPTYSGYNVRGVHYNTEDRDAIRSRQNSGVSVLASTWMHSENSSEKCYYGVITNIWEMDYTKFRIPLFRCNWVESKKGLKIDNDGFTLVDLNRIDYTTDPFVWATFVKQVFYIRDPRDSKWSIALKTPDREYFDYVGDDGFGDTISVYQPFSNGIPSIESLDLGGKHGNYMRSGDESIVATD